MKKNLSIKAIWFIAIIISLMHLTHSYWTKKDKVITWDVLEYYQYLPATIIHGDVKAEFLKEPNHGTCCFWPHTTPTGNYVFKFSMGMSILYLPFFLIAHAYASIFGPDALGYSPPYVLMLIVSSFFYFIIGLIFLRKVLIRYFSDKIVAISLILLAFGTNLFYYTTLRSTVSHAYNFSFIACFIYLTIKWHEKPKWITTILLGLSMGIISLIRPSNSIMISIFLLYDVYDKESLKNKFKLLINNPLKIILIPVMILLVWMPQMLYWHAVSGQFLYYSYDSEEGFFFNNPQIIRGVFGYRNGWLLYTPLMAFALLGILTLFKYLKSWGYVIAGLTLINIYIITSWWCWWYGGFGNRAFVDSYAFLALPLSAFIKHVQLKRKKWLNAMLTLIFLFLIFLNIFQTFQVKNGGIQPSSMTKKAYWYLFLNYDHGDKHWQYIAPPDIEKAKKGIQATVEKKK